VTGRHSNTYGYSEKLSTSIPFYPLALMVTNAVMVCWEGISIAMGCTSAASVPHLLSISGSRWSASMGQPL